MYCVYTSAGICGFVFWLYKRWVRSTLIYLYNTTIRCLINQFKKLIELYLNCSPPKPHAFISTSLQSSFFSFINFKDVFFNFGKNFLKYVILILPFILIFKASYSCFVKGVIDFQVFSQELISNLPFVGNRLLNFF